MSLYDYRVSMDLHHQDHPFYALIMAAMRKADTQNTVLLRDAYPHVWDELQARYNAPGGELPTDRLHDANITHSTFGPMHG